MSTRSPSHLLATRLGLAVAAALLLTACSGDDEAADDGRVVATAAPDRPLTVVGPDDGELLNADGVADLEVVVEAEVDDPETDATLDDLRILVDGDDVTDDADVDGTRLVWNPGELDDGDRVIAVASEPPAGETDGADEGDEAEEGDEPMGPEVLQHWRVTVDATPPEIELTEPDGPIVAGEAVTVAGTTQAGATVRVGDQESTADDDGSFAIELGDAPDGEVEIVAVDPAGNSSGTELALVTVASRAESPEAIRTAHVSFCGWREPALIDPIMERVEDGTFNAVQLDLKDESGMIGHETEVELAATIGADQPDCRVDLEEAIERLHAMDVPIIGRIVAFADPVLARWAWDNDARDMAVQTEGGELYTGQYAGFSNPVHEEVREYNVALAEEAARMGVDHILWDYIRTPDGASARFPGQDDQDMQDVIVGFTQQADEAISPYGAQHGASVYGISADRPSEVNQNIRRMAEHLDYMAPMIYPSHWGPGEYGVEQPLLQPYDMIAATLEVWLEETEGTRARVFPWLEDSNYPGSIGGPDRETYLVGQLEATYDAGVEEWMLWDSAVNYTLDAIILPEDR